MPKIEAAACQENAAAVAADTRLEHRRSLHIAGIANRCRIAISSGRGGHSRHTRRAGLAPCHHESDGRRNETLTAWSLGNPFRLGEAFHWSADLD